MKKYGLSGLITSRLPRFSTDFPLRAKDRRTAHYRCTVRAKGVKRGKGEG